MYYDSRAAELAAHLAFVDEIWKRCHGEWGDAPVIRLQYLRDFLADELREEKEKGESNGR